MQPKLQYEASRSISFGKLKPVVNFTSAVALPVREQFVRRVSVSESIVRTSEALAKAPTLEERLFDATSAAKIWTSRLAMHLPRETRDRLFRQLDALHEADEWADGDDPIFVGSYQCLVRAILLHRIDSRPALALMPNGNVLAMWSDGEDRLTVEFLPNNRTKWLVQSHTADGPERATGVVPLERLREVLQPYNADRWFDGR